MLGNMLSLSQTRYLTMTNCSIYRIVRVLCTTWCWIVGPEIERDDHYSALSEIDWMHGSIVLNDWKVAPSLSC